MTYSEVLNFVETHKCRIESSLPVGQDPLVYLNNVRYNEKAELNISNITHIDGTTNWIEIDVQLPETKQSITITQIIE